jgi:hypothetical protein
LYQDGITPEHSMSQKSLTLPFVSLLHYTINHHQQPQQQHHQAGLLSSIGFPESGLDIDERHHCVSLRERDTSFLLFISIGLRVQWGTEEEAFHDVWDIEEASLCFFSFLFSPTWP